MTAKDEADKKAADDAVRQKIKTILRLKRNKQERRAASGK